MSFNINSIPADVLARVYMGLEGDVQPLIDALGVPTVPVDNLSGTIPIMPSESTLANDSDGGLLAEGAIGKDFDMEMSNVTYALKRAEGKAFLADGTRVSLEGYGLAALEMFLMQCRRIVAKRININTNTLLSSTSLNQEQAAGTVWTNSSSTPFQNIQAARRLIGKSDDTAVFGSDVIEALQYHPDFLAEDANFDGAGFVGEGAVIAKIRAAFPNLRNIVVGSNLHSTAKEGQTVSLGYQFDGLVWLGAARDLLKLEMALPDVERARDMHRKGDWVSVNRRIEQKRLHDDMGVVISGVIA